MGEIQNVNKQINFNNLIDYFKGESGPKVFIGFKGPLVFYKNKKDGYITLEKSEEKQKEFKSGRNEILKGGYKSENHKGAIKKMLKHFTNHEKKLSNCLMIILRLQLRLNIDQFMEKD